MWLARLKSSVERYAEGKIWYWYLPLWVFGLYVYVQLFNFDMVKGHMPLVLLVPYSFDFLLHELAHIVTAFLPAVLCASAGSISELLLGTGLIVMALWQRSYFASLICFLWLDLAAQSAGQYMADAIPQRLPLVSLGAMLSGGEPKHDWHFVFGQLHLLGASYFIGDTVRVIGFLAGTFGILFTGWVLYMMSKAQQTTASNQAITLSGIAPPKAYPRVKPTQDSGFTSLPISTQTIGTEKPSDKPQSESERHHDLRI